jgi:hypothetical protein
MTRSSINPFALETLEIRRVLSVAGALAVAAEAVAVQPDVPVVQPLLPDPMSLEGCWSGYFAERGKAVMSFCIEVPEVDAEGGFEAVFSAYSALSVEPRVVIAEGTYDSLKGAFEMSWSDTRLFSGEIIGRIDPENGTMIATTTFGWMCTAHSGEFTLYRDADPRDGALTGGECYLPQKPQMFARRLVSDDPRELPVI